MIFIFNIILTSDLNLASNQNLIPELDLTSALPRRPRVTNRPWGALGAAWVLLNSRTPPEPPNDKPTKLGGACIFICLLQLSLNKPVAHLNLNIGVEVPVANSVATTLLALF